MEHLELAPVALFVYNRPDHAQKTVEALLRNELASETDLIVFADGPKENAAETTKQQIQAVRDYIGSISGFKSIECHFAEKNIGCADSIIRGVTETVNRYGKVIVVEDDIVTHPFFLRFMNEGLEFYKDDKRIFTIGGTCNNIQIPKKYKYEIFLSCRSVSWGWATWRDRWKSADWNIEKYDIIRHPTRGKIRKFNRGGEDMYDMLLMQLRGEIDAWDIRWDYCIHQHHGYTIVPTRTFATNCGLDGSGIHCGSGLGYSTTPLYDHSVFDLQFIPSIKPDRRILRAYRNFFHVCEPKVPIGKRIKRVIKFCLRKLNLMK